MQDYVTAFDLARAGFRTWPSAVYGLFFVVVGALFARNRRKLRGPKWIADTVAFFFLGFAVLWTVTELAFSYGQYSSLRRAMREGRVSVVEGPVEDFVPMSAANKETESFTVGGVPFRYSTYLITPGFRTGSIHGGPIRAGRLVRLTYVGGDIVRVEIHR